jgi:hypothetical protein
MCCREGSAQVEKRAKREFNCLFCVQQGLWNASTGDLRSLMPCWLGRRLVSVIRGMVDLPSIMA